MPIGTIVVSGGAAGPDSWAVDAARERGLPVIVYRPHLAGVMSRFDATERYYGRNQRIVDDCDRLIAFPAPDRKGGTEDTIRRALRASRSISVEWRRRGGPSISTSFGAATGAAVSAQSREIE